MPYIKHDISDESISQNVTDTHGNNKWHKVVIRLKSNILKLEKQLDSSKSKVLSFSNYTQTDEELCQIGRNINVADIGVQIIPLSGENVYQHTNQKSKLHLSREEISTQTNFDQTSKTNLITMDELNDLHKNVDMVKILKLQMSGVEKDLQFSKLEIHSITFNNSLEIKRLNESISELQTVNKNLYNELNENNDKHIKLQKELQADAVLVTLRNIDTHPDFITENDKTNSLVSDKSQQVDNVTQDDLNIISKNEEILDIPILNKIDSYYDVSGNEKADIIVIENCLYLKNQDNSSPEGVDDEVFDSLDLELDEMRQITAESINATNDLINYLVEYENDDEEIEKEIMFMQALAQESISASEQLISTFSGKNHEYDSSYNDF
jgi:peroxiredoxin